MASSNSQSISQATTTTSTAVADAFAAVSHPPLSHGLVGCCNLYHATTHVMSLLQNDCCQYTFMGPSATNLLGWLLQVRGGTSAQTAAQAAATTISRAVATAIASASAKVTTSGKPAITIKSHTIPISAMCCIVGMHMPFAGVYPCLTQRCMHVTEYPRTVNGGNVDGCRSGGVWEC